MAYTALEARQELLDTLATAADEIGLALAYLGEAYEQVDEYAAQGLEEALFRPVQLAYGRAKRTYAGFAEQHGLGGRVFEARVATVREHDARGIIERAVDAAATAESVLATLQDSMLPVEAGDPELRAGLAEVRRLLGDVRSRARELIRTLGR